MKLDLEALDVQSFATQELPSYATLESGANTCYFCNLSDDDFTCRYTCSSQPPGLTCYDGCQIQPE